MTQEAVETIDTKEWNNMVRYSPDGKKLLVAVGPLVKVYDVSEGKANLLQDIQTKSHIVKIAVFSPDGSLIFAAGQSNLI